MKINRFMIAAPSSGSGKTLITCGLLRLLQRQGHRIASFKCGPDFIDPMFHTKVIGTRSRNLDPFFTGRERTRMLLARNAASCDLAVMEGVMGYYDGIGLDSSEAGSSDLARITDTPVFLIVPAKGVSRSILPMIRGFLDFQEKKCIRGVILNRISPMLYPRMKAMIEKDTGISVVGYVPQMDDCALESRHLGLLLPDEVDSLQQKLDRMADVLEKSLDIPQMLQIADAAPEIPDDEIQRAEEHCRQEMDSVSRQADAEPPKVRIGLAEDEAFCFFYQDNLDLLRENGAELVPFSPMHEAHLPEHLDGLLLHGGYPELYGKELSENTSMREEIREAIENGIPTQAECGGFLYLHSSLTDLQKNTWKMAGVFPEKAYYTGRLQRFGYNTLSGGTIWGTDAGPIRTHEFHYYESENPGDAYLAEKPSGKRSWRCVRSSRTLYAGFPHLYYYANLKVPAAFLSRCREYHKNGRGQE